MKELLEEIIHHVYTDEDQYYLLFIMNMEWYFLYEAKGECCSTSWFESINGLDNLISNTIIGIEIKPERELNNDDPDIYTKVYGYTLKTNKGYCDIEMRNSSNGYYGGYCEYIPIYKNNYAKDLNELEDQLYRKLPLQLTLNGKKITFNPWKDDK